MSKFNYKKAEADLYDVGAHHPDEIYDYKSEKSFRSFMKENGLNPDKYYKPDGKSGSSHTGHSGHGSSSGTDGCYLTSACVMAKGLPDHCEELETLRVFRDEYLAGQPGGRAEIEQYYATAPRIVEAINRLPNHLEIWNRVYEEMVEPCIRMIHANQHEQAHQHYKSYASNLAQIYLIPEG